MSRLIFKGDTANNFGKELPVPYIERIELRNVIGAEDPRELWLTDDATGRLGGHDYAVDIFNGLTKITLKLSIFFNCDDLIQEDPELIWTVMNDNLDLNVLLVAGNFDEGGSPTPSENFKSPIKLLIDSKQYLKKAIYGDYLGGAAIDAAAMENARAESTGFGGSPLGDEEAAQYAILKELGAGGGYEPLYKGNYTYSFPLKNQNTEVSFSGDFDTNFQRVLKISGIELEIFVPSIDAAHNLALFVGTSAIPFAELESQNGKAFALNSSDLAYEYIMKGGSLATKNQEGWFTKKEDDFYTGRPLRALNKKYYKSDDFGSDQIIKNMKSVIDEYKRFSQDFSDVETSIINIMYIIARFKSDPNFLNELNEYRKAYPQKTPDTKAGQMYEDFARAISNSNVLLRRQNELYKKQIRNIKIRDLRPFQYDNVFIGSYAGPEPLPDGSYADVIMGDDDFLYRSMYQSTVAKYIPGNKTLFDTEMEYDTDELESAVSDAIERILDKNYFGNLVSWRGISWGNNKIDEYATAMNQSLKEFRNYMSHPSNQYPGGDNDYVHWKMGMSFTSGDRYEGYGVCAAWQIIRGEGGGLFSYCGISEIPDISWNYGHGAAGHGKQNEDSALVICRQDTTFGGGTMAESRRDSMWNGDVQAEQRLINTFKAGSTPYGYTGQGPCLILRSLNNIGGQGMSSAGSYMRSTGWGPGEGWGLHSHEETYTRIYNAMKYDHWGPFTLLGAYPEDTEDANHPREQTESAFNKCGGDQKSGFMFEACAIRPALKKVLNKYGFAGQHTDPSTAAGLVGDGSGLLLKAATDLSTYSELGIDEWDFSDPSERRDAARWLVLEMREQFMEEAVANITRTWGNTPTYKQRLPKSSGRGMYEQSEGNPDPELGYTLRIGNASWLSSRYSHYNCHAADHWMEDHGMINSWGGHWSWIWRGGPFGTNGPYNPDGGTDSWGSAITACGSGADGYGCGAKSKDFGLEFRQGGLPFTKSGFPSGYAYNINGMPLGIMEKNFGNDIMYITTILWDDHHEGLVEAVQEIFELLDLHWGKPLGDNRHNKLAHVDIIANKYGWFFADLEKYHRKYSNISRYMNIPMALSYYPELREFMNYAIRPRQVWLQYFPQLGDQSTGGFDSTIIPSMQLKLDHDDREWTNTLAAGSNVSATMGAESYARCDGQALTNPSNTVHTMGRPPYCQVEVLDAPTWGDFTWNADSDKFQYNTGNYGGETGNVGNETLWSYIMMRNLDLAFTSAVANAAGGVTDGTGLAGVEALEDSRADLFNNNIPDNYRLLAYNYNFYMDDDLANGQRDKYNISWKVTDHSIDLLVVFSEFFEDVYLNFIDNYYNLAIENCAFDNINSKFNTFFGEEMERRYEGELKHHAPWFAAPALYAVYRDMFQNAYGGDRFLMEDDARSISDSINPTTGFLDALVAFKQRLEDFYDFLIQVQTDAEASSHEREYEFVQNGMTFDQPVIGIVADPTSLDEVLDAGLDPG